MLMERYQEAIDELFKKVRETQKENMIKAGEIVAESVANGGCIYLHHICHGVEGDLIYRGGGPSFYKRLNFDLKVDTPGRERDRSDLGLDQEAADVKYVLLMGNIRPGDVIFVSSVSGRTKRANDIAYEATKMGVKVIALTSMSYATEVDPVHPSGKKLYELATLAIDNCAPPAEAMLHVDGIEAPFAAASGMASNYIMWNITSIAVEKLMEKGITPGIFKSANYPGGNDYNMEKIWPQYNEFGW